MSESAASPATHYDVVLCGGGLAGLTLALQLKMRRPEIRVLVLEKKRHPVSEAAHKVGESSVEIGAHYFTHVLGELEHFEQAQLPKLGLRYFFGDGDLHDLSTRTELGGNTFFPSRSWQIDRGRFENHLARRCQERGIDFVDAAIVRSLDLSGRQAAHRITYAHEGQSRMVSARWVVDASGRAGLIKRKLALAKPCGHRANAVWWRYDRKIAIDDWSTDPAWAAQGANQRSRWLSTVHFMGKGYWVWFIPLSSGSHSVGIVVDETLHPFASISSYDKALEWLRLHEPQCAAQCAGRDDQLQDFLGLKDYSYSSTQVYSDDRWACTGEAGAFLDPFYSPGSDFIAMGNTFITDLVERDLRHESISTRTDFYNRIYFTFFENHLTLYEGQMPLFDNAKVMAVKIIWDFAYYWSVPAAFFFHNRQTDLMAFAQAKDALDRSGLLNRRIQRLFREWHAVSPRIARTFFDIPGLSFMHALNRSLRDELDEAQFAARLARNLAELDHLAREIRTIAGEDLPEAALDGLPPACEEGEFRLLASILPQLRARPLIAGTAS
jgi:flavin-dependent dehydrogenase